ncbi:META domain-containing protein [Winogradskyella alexanderae]|uniref:META domain-containing protein n=1 Tax=Winogradskyella alexanderae TaxID=2877123 RepID=A0ABS7XNX3_9FLAO|nr:META domain-containing protein [Winogradskyella alexanderae]MCA0131168.1 META domain-containing protein [Winogradskyella alexanderae]
MKFLLSLFSVVLLADSCNSEKNPMESKRTDQNSLYGNYIVTYLGTKVIESKTLKISFSKTNEVKGFGGCNSFFGSFALDESKITFGNIASSKKFCGKEISTTERHFLTALNQTKELALTDNALSLSADNNVLLKAVKIDEEKDTMEKMTVLKPIVIYKTISRGSFEYIKISGTKVSLSTDKDLKSFSDYNCAEKAQNELHELLNQIDLNSLNKLKAPTDKRLFDGAPIATLTILKNKAEFTTPGFDHGYPPDEIKALVNKVLSIKENATKK